MANKQNLPDYCEIIKLKEWVITGGKTHVYMKVLFMTDSVLQFSEGRDGLFNK